MNIASSIKGLKERKMPEVINKDGFKKFDTGKLRYDMIPNNVLELWIKVMMYGAFDKGYGVDNWKLAKTDEDLLRYYNAGRRHDEAHRAGEYLDPESGLPHLAHKLCNDAFRLFLEEEKRNDKQTTKASNS